jgi:hypothetical protein
MAVGVGRVFAFWGDLDRQRRRRVRFVQEVGPRIPQLSHHYTLT